MKKKTNIILLVTLFIILSISVLLMSVFLDYAIMASNPGNAHSLWTLEEAITGSIIFGVVSIIVVVFEIILIVKLFKRPPTSSK